MKNYLIILFILQLYACSPDSAKHQDNSELSNSFETSNLTIGERIDGPANVRDSINGEIIFKLYDNVLIECTQAKNDWYTIAIDPTNPPEDYDRNFIKKGTKILVGNQVVGETIKDAEVTMGMVGYTHKNNIKPKTIIENALDSHFEKITGKRTLDDFKSFINDFELEKDDQFDGLTVYYNYENWIDDPSPMMRIGLVFKDSKLIAILHSRPLTIKGTTKHKLNYAFNCLTFDDLDSPDKIVKTFSHFVNSAD